MERFLVNFYAALDVSFAPEEFITSGEHVVAIGRLRGRTRDGTVPIDVPFAHDWTFRHHLLEHLRFFTDTATLAQALREGGR